MLMAGCIEDGETECISMGGLGRGRCEKRDTILSSSSDAVCVTTASSFLTSSTLGFLLESSAVAGEALSFLSPFVGGFDLPPSA